MPESEHMTQSKMCGQVEHIGQIPNTLAAAHFLATTPLFQEKAIFILVEEPNERAILARDIPQFISENDNRCIINFDGSAHQLFSILNDQANIIIADQFTIDSLQLPSPEAFKKKMLSITVGDLLPMQTVKEFVVNTGFDVDKTANAHGKWATRGNIIDIHQKTPVRIEFNGDTIERITEFDLETGSTIAPVDTITIVPQQLYGKSTVLEFISSDTRIILYHHDPLEDIPQSQTILEPVQVPIGRNAGYSEPKAYHQRIPTLVSDLQRYTNAYAYTQQVEKVRGFLKDLTHVMVHDIPTASRGFIHEESSTIIVTDTSIGITEARRKKQQAKAQEAMIQELTPGDYVVHLFHGISRFARMDTMEINGMQREYFVLEFAGNDKIYVPVELAERIDKYVGDDKPKLNGLGGASWNEAVAKVRASTLEMARELLELYARRSTATAPQFTEQPEEKEFDAAFPYNLTEDQLQAVEDITADMAQEEPMDRLLCGDVGFGKTEVAMRAAFRAVLNGYQVALLAPTTVLAQQHYDNFAERMKNFGVVVEQLSRLRSKSDQQKGVDGIAAGSVDIVIGTHRLLSKDIHFKRLGLIIVDEEQRFGVTAKETLKKLRTTVHALAMTATPIPRTLHLSITGLRDISTILTPPAARKSVQLSIQPFDVHIAKEAIEKELARDGQVYYVYNRVRTIELVRERLQEMLPEARIDIAHGQMKPESLAQVMHKFDVGEIDILLATSIVENGLDVPRANTLIVEKASLFGLSELYQLKGRVGRADRQGYAYFFYNEDSLQGDVRKRFIALQEAEELGSGFELAMKDMEIRGVGNLLGKQQHGQAVKIGLNLYLRLLQQAIRELENTDEPTKPERDVPIDLPIESRIPERLLPDQGDRILLYQQLANIRDRSRLLEKREQFTREERFSEKGTLPIELQGLFNILEIKLLASRTPLIEVKTDYPNKVNRLDSPRISIISTDIFTTITGDWEYVLTRDGQPEKIRTTVKELGDNWVEKIKQILLSLQYTPVE